MTSLTVREIENRLERQASAVARALLPRGQVSKCRKFWEVGSGKGKSLKVHIDGERVGKWADFAIDGMSGDLLDLIQETQGLEKRDAIQWAKRFLGIEDGPRDQGPIDHGERDRRRAEQEAIEERDAQRRRERAEEDRKLRSAQALDLWSAAENAAGTPVERYYRARGIPGAPPPTIKYLRRCWHAPSKLWLPAAIAAIQGPPVLIGDKMKSLIVAVHRTYLDPVKAQKADVEPNKMMLGDNPFGAVRLTGAAPKLILCEGIETGLSLKVQDTAAVWCGLSVGGMVRAWIPDDVTELYLAVDGDRVGSASWYEARSAAVRRHSRPGRIIRFHEPPAGMDWNDVARLRAGGLK